MKNYKLRRQETDYFCFPACLQAVLREHSIMLTQQQIAEQVLCTENGTAVKNIGRFLATLGFLYRGYNYNEVPFKEPEILLQDNFGKSHILIAKPHPRGNHFVLLEDFLYPDIVIADPKECKRYREDLNALYERMFKEKSGAFDLISGSS